MWAHRLVRRGDESKVEPDPAKCDECDADLQAYFGCGFHGYLGKGTAPYEQGGTVEPWSKTCPRYCWRMPGVQQLHSDLRDFSRAAYGNTLDMEALHLELLRVLEAERDVWEAENQRQMRQR